MVRFEYTMGIYCISFLVLTSCVFETQSGVVLKNFKSRRMVMAEFERDEQEKQSQTNNSDLKVNPVNKLKNTSEVFKGVEEGEENLSLSHDLVNVTEKKPKSTEMTNNISISLEESKSASKPITPTPEFNQSVVEYAVDIRSLKTEDSRSLREIFENELVGNQVFEDFDKINDLLSLLRTNITENADLKEKKEIVENKNSTLSERKSRNINTSGTSNEISDQNNLDDTNAASLITKRNTTQLADTNISGLQDQNMEPTKNLSRSDKEFLDISGMPNKKILNHSVIAEASIEPLLNKTTKDLLNIVVSNLTNQKTPVVDFEKKPTNISEMNEILLHDENTSQSTEVNNRTQIEELDLSSKATNQNISGQIILEPDNESAIQLDKNEIEHLTNFENLSNTSNFTSSNEQVDKIDPIKASNAFNSASPNEQVKETDSINTNSFSNFTTLNEQVNETDLINSGNSSNFASPNEKVNEADSTNIVNATNFSSSNEHETDSIKTGNASVSSPSEQINETDVESVLSSGINFLVNSDVAQTAAAMAMEVLNLTDHVIEDNDLHSIIDMVMPSLSTQESLAENREELNETSNVEQNGTNSNFSTRLNESSIQYADNVPLGSVSSATVNSSQVRECPPPGICIFWFMSQDACSNDDQCLDGKLCCKIRCSKKCIDV